MNPLDVRFVNESEERQHRSQIDHLMRELRVNEPGVLYLYDFILRRYLKTARIREFLPIFVGRRVKDLLRDHAGAGRNIDFEGRGHRAPYP